jgi:hypothetical protein
MFPWGIRYYHMILVAVVIVLIVLLLRTVKAKAKIAQLSILFAISPLFAYFLYVMVAEEDAHGGMGFGEVFMFFVGAFVIDRIFGEREENGVKGFSLKGVLRNAAIVLIFVIAFMFARFANVCYLKAQIMQAEAINYYNTLISRIQMTEGYTSETPVAYVEPRKKNDEALMGTKLFEPIYLPPYQGNSIINDFAWQETMELWCAFAPVSGSVPDSANVAEMPCYPAEGSIKMVDGTVVVKFSD